MGQMDGTAPLLASASPCERKASQDQQFEERRRIAERLVQDLREAGYSCELVGDGDDGLLKHQD
jgi:hypothetical protein